MSKTRKMTLPAAIRDIERNNGKKLRKLSPAKQDDLYFEWQAKRFVMASRKRLAILLLLTLWCGVTWLPAVASTFTEPHAALGVMLLRGGAVLLLLAAVFFQWAMPLERPRTPLERVLSDGAPASFVDEVTSRRPSASVHPIGKGGDRLH